MIYYLNGVILANSVPGEKTLQIYVSEETGTLLHQNLQEIIREYGKHITCICLAGNIEDQHELAIVFKDIHKAGLKTCLFTKFKELSQINLNIIDELDYIKLGYSKRPFEAETFTSFLKKDYSPFGDITDWISM